MRILVAQRHYWPDVPTYAALARHISLHLSEVGHDVTVFSARPSYNKAYAGPKPPRRERVGGVRVIRMWIPRERKGSTLLRILDTAWFLMGLLGHLVLRRRYDLVMVTNSPPVVTAALVRRVSRTRYIYLCQDIQPEIGVASGMIRPGWAQRRLARMDDKNCTQAAAVVVLSNDMRSTLLERGLDGDNIEVINNFILTEAKSDVPPNLARDQDVYRVLFSGNMGRFQGLDKVVEAAHQLAAHSDIEFLFLGSGVEVDALRRQAGDLVGKTVRFEAHLPMDQAMSVAADSQLGLISLRPGTYRLAYPSKTMAYLEAGCRLLVVVEPESQLADMVRTKDLGTICASADSDAIAAAILSERERFNTRGEEREAQRSAARELFGRHATLRRWAELVAGIAQ